MNESGHADLRLRSFVSGFVGGICFGTASIFIRLISLNAISIVVWRLLLGGGFLLLLLGISGKRLRLYLVPSFYLGIVLLLHFIFFVKSVQDTFIINATVIVNSAPLITLAISYILRIEKISEYDIVIVILGFLGTLIMSWGSFQLGYGLIGDIEALIAALMISLYSLLARRMVKNRLDPYKLAGPVYFIAGLMGLLLAGHLQIFELPAGLDDMTYILLLAIIPTAIGHTLFLRSLRGLAPHEAQILALLEPIVATILAVILLNEVPPLTSITGSLLICLSIILLSIRSARE